ncbi:MAG: cupin domain-containing protein [Chloroflexota bacterium]
MNRRALARFALALVALPASGGASRPLVAARQDESATPEPGPRPSRTMLAAELAELPPPPAFLRLVRIVLQPGASVPMHSHPGPELGVVEHGVLTVQTGGGAAVSSASGAPVEIPASGATFDLSPGDQIVYPAGMPFGFRNDGDRPAAVLTVVVLPAGSGRPPGSEWVNGAPGADAMEGVSSVILGDAAAPGWPEAPLTVQIDALELDPGDALPGWPGPALVAVEAGQLGFTLLGGEYQLSGTGREPEVRSAAGVEQTLAAGDAAFFPGGMNDLPRDPQQGSASVIRFGVAARAAAAAAGPATPPPTLATPVAAALDGASEAITAEAGVRLRGGPSTSAAVVAELEAGVLVTITGPAVEADGFAWFPVALADDPATSGYIAQPGLAAAP